MEKFEGSTEFRSVMIGVTRAAFDAVHGQPVDGGVRTIRVPRFEDQIEGPLVSVKQRWASYADGSQWFQSPRLERGIGFEYPIAEEGV